MGNVLVSNLNFFTINLLVEKEYEDIKKSGKANDYHFVVKGNRFILLQKSNWLLGRIWFQFQVFFGLIKTSSESKSLIREKIHRLKSDPEMQQFFASQVTPTDKINDFQKPKFNSNDDQILDLIPRAEFDRKIMEVNKDFEVLKVTLFNAENRATELEKILLAEQTKKEDDLREAKELILAEEKGKIDNIEKVAKSRLNLATTRMEKLGKEVDALGIKKLTLELEVDLKMMKISELEDKAETMDSQIQELSKIVASQDTKLIELQKENIDKDDTILELRKSRKNEFIQHIQEANDLDEKNFAEELKENCSDEDSEKSLQNEEETDSMQSLIRELTVDFDNPKNNEKTDEENLSNEQKFALQNTNENKKVQ